jgi:ABC-type sugar transport system permease subunit
MTSRFSGFGRGFFAVVGLTCGIFFTSLAILRLELAIGILVISPISMGIAMVWVFVFFPYVVATPEIFTNSQGLTFGLFQWVLVGTVVGRFTSGMPRWRALVWAVLAVIVVSVLTHALLRGLGYTVIVEGP